MEEAVDRLVAALQAAGMPSVASALPNCRPEDLIPDETLDGILEDIHSQCDPYPHLSEALAAMELVEKAVGKTGGAELWNVMSTRGISGGLFSAFTQVLSRSRGSGERLRWSIATATLYLRWSLAAIASQRQFSTLCFRSSFSLVHRLIVSFAKIELREETAKFHSKSQRGRSEERPSKRRRRKSEDEEETDAPLEQLQLDDDEEDGEERIPSSELVAASLDILRYQKLLLEGATFDNSSEWFRFSVDTLITIIGETKRMSDASQKRVVEAAIATLSAASREAHGPLFSLIKEILRCCVPEVGMTAASSKQIDVTSRTALIVGRVQAAENAVVTLRTLNRELRLTDVVGGYLAKEQVDEQDAVLEALQTFCQYLAFHVPDRAEIRHYAAQTIISILELLRRTDIYKDFFTRFCRFCSRLSRNTRAPLRHTAVEVAAAVVRSLTQAEQKTEGSALLLSILMERVSDKSASVRSKALSSVAAVIEDGHVRPKDFYDNPVASTEGDVANEALRSERAPEVASPLSPAIARRTPPPLSPSSITREGLGEILRRRCKDEKSGVRKGALQVLERVVVAAFQEENETDVSGERSESGPQRMIEERASSRGPSSLHSNLYPLAFELCLDAAVSVRRQAVISCCSILEASAAHPGVQAAWVEYTLPLVNDDEQGVVDDLVPPSIRLCFEALATKKAGVTEGAKASAISLHRRLKHEDSRLVRKLISLGHSKKLLQPHHLRNVWKELMLAFWGEEEGERGSIVERGAFISLLSTVQAIAEVCPSAANTEDVEKLWGAARAQLDVLSDEHSHRTASVIAEIASRSLDLLSLVADRLEEGLAKKEGEVLISLIRRFLLHPSVVKSMLHALPLLLSSSSSEKHLQTILKDTVKQATKKLEAFLQKQQTASAVSTHQLSVLLFTIGEASLILGSAPPVETVRVVQAFITHEEIVTGQGETSFLSSHASVDTASLEPSSSHVELKAHSLLSLGKLSLCDESLAKKTIALLLREMEESPHPAVRNNVLIVLCEMCVQFTALVDHYTGKLSACLRDKNRLIRRHAVALLTALLQAEYIKWKGPIFFRFLIAVVDKDSQVRQLARVCLRKLAQKYSHGRRPGSAASGAERSIDRNLFYANFIECFFTLNGYAYHEKYNRFASSMDERSLSMMAGEENVQRRKEVYRFLLSNVSPEQKFLLLGRICQDVLGSYADLQTPLPDPTASVLSADEEASYGMLSDALWVLSTPDIRPSPSRGVSALSGAEGGEGEEEALLEARGKVFSRISRKNLMENVIPILAELKRLLERKHSPLLRDLNHAMRELIRDYKEEIEEIVAADRQLAKELAFDLTEGNAAQRRTAEPSRARTPAAATPQSELKSVVRGNVSVPQLKSRSARD